MVSVATCEGCCPAIIILGAGGACVFVHIGGRQKSHVLRACRAAAYSLLRAGSALLKPSHTSIARLDDKRAATACILVLCHLKQERGREVYCARRTTVARDRRARYVGACNLSEAPLGMQPRVGCVALKRAGAVGRKVEPLVGWEEDVLECRLIGARKRMRVRGRRGGTGRAGSTAPHHRCCDWVEG